MDSIPPEARDRYVIRFFDCESVVSSWNPVMGAIVRKILGGRGPQAVEDNVEREMAQDASDMARLGYRVVSRQRVDLFHRVYQVTYKLRVAPKLIDGTP